MRNHFQNKKGSFIIYWDLEGAFNKPEHNTVIEDLENIQAPLRLINVIKILLNNYKVTLDGINCIDIDIGLP